MKYIIGLGNPEKKYENTFHNAGFMTVDNLAHRLNISFTKKKCLSLCAEGTFKGEGVMLFKPLTYMNLSGDAVLKVMSKLGAKPHDILVIYDDVDLPEGTFRFRESGSGGTHNGMRDVIRKTGSTDIRRLRIGIGKDDKIPLIDYVLMKMSGEKKDLIEKAVNLASEFIEENFL